MKEYWFAIYPYCFLWLKGEEGLVYNTENFKKMRFRNSGLTRQKAEGLAEMGNLYCIRLTDEELADKELNEWVQTLVNSGCGTLVEDDGMNQRPLSLPPILKVQDEAGYYRWEHNLGIDGNVIENLHRIIFHINGSENGNGLYAKQTNYPTTNGGMLAAEAILRFAMNARSSSFLNGISLIGNPFVYEGLDGLIDSLKTICPVSVYCTWEDVRHSLDRARALAERANLHIVVKDCTTLENLPQDASYTFLVTSEEEYEEALECEKKYNIGRMGIVPVYNGSNRNFFEECLYMDEAGIQEIALDKREVFIRQKLNIQDFGKLTVMTDGKVYANVNHEPIGTIEATPQSIVYREITEGHSWLRVRNQKPCCDCVFQWLCPSPSNYEIAIAKDNLCHVRR